jgi:uncharacterized membrane protein
MTELAGAALALITVAAIWLGLRIAAAVSRMNAQMDAHIRTVLARTDLDRWNKEMQQ